jgi:hypothetical protein
VRRYQLRRWNLGDEGNVGYHAKEKVERSARLLGTVSVKHEFLRLGLDLRQHGPAAVSEALRMHSQIGVACIIRGSFVHLAHHTGTNHIAQACIGG